MTPLIRGLMKAEAYDHPVSEFQLLETHISWVILTGDFAYKLKKPVDLGFVDFTTLERRRHFCHEEIRLNHRLAADMYLGVRPIYGAPDAPSFARTAAQQEEPIEYAVQMRQFDQRMLLPAVLERGELQPDHIDRLAVDVANFHRSTAVADAESPYGTIEAVRAPAIANFDALQSLTHDLDLVAGLRDWTEAEFGRRRDWFQQRHHQGWIRECHGDMHLGNMVLLDDIIRIFDCLEFNPELRWIDVMGEIAFLVMDLQDRGRPDLGIRVLNRWLEQMGDYDGLTGWKWYLVYRAMVRAKVAALRLRQPELTPSELEQKQRELTTYLELARSWTVERPAAVIITHGVSGSGKSHVAQWICERFGGIRLRSDVERKRLFGIWGASGPLRLTGDVYAPEVTRTLYQDVLVKHVPHILEAGFVAVIDATFLRQWQRTVFRDVAAHLRVPFVIVDVFASRETMRRRIESRHAVANDPSDATVAVMEQQLQSHEPLTDDELKLTVAVDTESNDWATDLDIRVKALFRGGLLDSR